MKINHIYRSLIVYHNEDDNTYIIDGYNEKFNTTKEANKFIKNLNFKSILDDSAVANLTKLGYFRTSFIIKFENMVIKEKWSNHEVELTFHYDSKYFDIEGNINSKEFFRIAKLLYNCPDERNAQQGLLNGVIRGEIKSVVGRNKVKLGAKDIDKISKSVASCVHSHVASNMAKYV